MRISLSRTIVAGATSGLMLVSLTGTAGAWGSYDRDDDQRGDAASYINGDGGVNADVDPGSSCFRPDQYDMQAFSDPGTGAGNRNVHNDACFLDDKGNKVDGPASFEVEGVGFISACPDPDGAGPKVAIRSADKKLCFQSGYQQKGIAGDLEFHARLNNEGQAGTQYVTWCSDSDRDGCDDERNKDSIRIDWSEDGTASYSDDDRDSYGSYSWS